MNSILARFARDRGGNFGMMTALIIVPLLGTVGVSLDVQHALNARNELLNAADAAAIGAIATSSPGVKAAMSSANEGKITIADEDARKLFMAQVPAELQDMVTGVQIDISKVGRDLSANVSFTANVPTTLLQVLRKNQISVSGTSVAKNSLGSYIDFYMLLDNTPSMGVGATYADIDKLERNTGDSCAFACHDLSNANNYYNLAKKLNVSMRIDLVRQATQQLTYKAADSMVVANQYRMGVYTFGAAATDARLTTISAPNGNMQQVRTYANAIDLMTIPYQNYNKDQLTDFDAALTSMKSIIGTSGSGGTSSSPQKVLFFVSDGLGDSNKPTTCTKRTNGTRCQEPIDISFCKPLKDQGVKIAVLYTTYLPLPKNDWYNNWIKPFAGEIATRMKACASDDLFFEVSPSEGIAEAMNALFGKVIGRPRLSS